LRRVAGSLRNQAVLKKRMFARWGRVILVAGLAAGCAGARELSKEEYVSKLNAMCKDFSAREQEIGEPRTLADLVDKGPRILDAFEEAIADKVGTLNAPDEIADQADRMVDIADEQRDVLDELVDAATDSDFAEVQRLVSKNDALNKESNSIARELGADACA
jgi:hypothetical protein